MSMTPALAIHIAAALAATLIGPIALWARRRGTAPHPRLHRWAGVTWVLLMLITAGSAVAMGMARAQTQGQWLVLDTPVQALILVTLAGLGFGLWRLAQRDIAGHRAAMRGTYIGACLVAGAFTLLPGRYLGQLVWHDWLGVLPAA